MRDNDWLIERLDQIWECLFPDLEKKNLVNIQFKGKWKNKFGHIKRKKDKSTEIAINGILKDPQIPECLIDITIAHELVHYMHGFNSPHPQIYKHPHAGGIVTKELKKRGFHHQMKIEKDFLQNKWMYFVKKYKE